MVVVIPPDISGVLDQQAEVRLTNSSNQTTHPLPVQFLAARELQRLDTDTHRDLIVVNPECYTAATDDWCGGVSAGDPRWPGGRSFIGHHYKQCCRSVSGNDVYSIELKNGWNLPNLNPWWSQVGLLSLPYMSNPVLTYGDSGGYTTCTFYNSEGTVYPGVASASSDPAFTAQVSFFGTSTGHVAAHDM